MNISIIGGGITGLTTALALDKVGMSSTVYEQAPDLNEIGAGLWLQPNAVKILQWLGLEDEIIKEGCVLNKMEITYPDLTPIRKINQTVVSDDDGNQTIAIHRGRLQSILYNHCNQLGIVKLGMPYLKHEVSGSKVRIQFPDVSVTSDLLLGADGIHSKVRKAMGLTSDYRYSKQICCRGIANNMQLPSHLKYEGKEAWGRKLRFGFSQLSDSKVYFFAVINQEICPEVPTIETLSRMYRQFDPVVTEIINATESLHTTELADLKRLNVWHSGNVCLLGDAAHATTPNMGQGACQGIEDAYYLSNILKNGLGSIPDIFERFEKKRRKKVDYVVNNSWRFGKMAHSSTGQMLLKGVMKLTPESVMSKQMNELYEIEEFQ